MKSAFVSTLSAVLWLACCDFANAQDTTGRGMECYLEHCRSCHGSGAADFTARSLQLGGDGTIQTKPLSAFLSTHGAADERDRRELLVLFEKLMRTDGR